MKPSLLLFLCFLAGLDFLSRAVADDAAPSAEARMRQVLRDTMGQLRDAQNQVVTLQATQAQSDKDKADLQAKADALSAQLKTSSDQGAADKAAAEKSIDDLKSKVTDQKGQIDRLNEGLTQWKDAYGQVEQLAASREAARAQYAMQAALLQRTVEDRETKNLALFKLSNEILTRYENFGLGDAITAREPFVGTSRVKLENLVQDYKNKILDQAITTGQTSSAPEVRATPVPSVTPAPAKVQKADATVPPKSVGATSI